MSNHYSTLKNLNFAGTHMMVFTAMKHTNWERMWENSNYTLKTAIDAAIKDRQWTADQALVTSSLANAGYCTFPNAGVALIFC